VLTNPWLTYIAKETLPFRHFSFSEKSHPTFTRILIAFRSSLAFAKPSAQKTRLLTKTFYVVMLRKIEYEFYLSNDK
jgi:hypothetical protein